MIDPELELLALERMERWQDPLKFWRASSPGQRDLIRYVAGGVEAYAHGGNGCGKSNGGCAMDLAFLTGRESLDGVRLPVIEPPVHWLLGVKSYKLGALGPVQALRELLAGWDHEEGPIKADNCPGVFHVRHAKSRNRSEWSQMFIVPYESESPEGPRVDGWGADEIPPVKFLGAFRSRMKAGRKLFGSIRATPIDKREWEPILEQFPKRVGIVEGGRVRLQWSVFDNSAMPPWQLEEFRQRAKGDPWERARLYGDHVNVSGGCPWPVDLLQAAIERCVPPRRVEQLVAKDALDGRAQATLQVWEDAAEGEACYAVFDPSSGVNNGKNDPACIHIRSRVHKGLKARIHGYFPEWAAGDFLADLHPRYNQMVIDPLVTGGRGLQAIRRLRERGVYSFTHDRVEIRPGDWQERIGTTETHSMRGEMIGAVEREILSGEFRCPSSEVISCLMDCIVDEKGKVVAGPGAHDEDLICWGRGSVYLGQWAAAKPKNPALKRYEHPNKRILKAIEKRDEEIALKYAPKIGPAMRRRLNGSDAVTLDP